jgi:DNA-directed RNA polymerase beta' subunit
MSCLDFEALFTAAYDATSMEITGEKRSELIVEQDEVSEHTEMMKALPEATLASITYASMTTKRIEEIAVCEITKGLDRNGDTLGTVLSRQLGVCHASEGPCLHCGLTMPQGCLGHFGLIRLVRPMFHPPAVGTLPAILNLLCHKCGCLRLDPIETDDDVLRLPAGILRWERLAQRVGLGLKCARQLPGRTEPCGTFPVVCTHHANKTSTNTLRMGKVNRDASDVVTLLRRVSEEDARILGFQSTEKLVSKFIVEVVPVPGNRMRPTSGVIADPMTTLLDSLWKRNNALRAALRKEDKETVMNRATEVFNTLSEIAANSNSSRPNATKGLLPLKLNCKFGLVRLKLAFKRVDFSGRGVMIPAARNRPNVITIPYFFRKILTPTVRVTLYNLQWIQSLQAKGELAGIQEPQLSVSGKPTYLRTKAQIARYPLRVGDVVLRYLNEDDLLNYVRNPTLHVHGMQVFHIIFWKNRANMNVGMPYAYYLVMGGDFDGDAGQLFAVFEEEARAEAYNINSPRWNLVSRITGSGLSGPHYNTPPACRKLSILRHIPEHVRSACLSVIDDCGQLATLEERLAMHGVPANSGPALFSAALPPRTSLGTGKDAVVIRDGILLRGELHVNIIREGQGSLVKAILFQSGGVAAEDYVYNLARLCDEFLRHDVVTVGPDDMNLPIGDPEYIPQLIETLEERVQKLYDSSLTDHERESYIGTELVNFSNAIDYHVESNFAKYETELNNLTGARTSKISKNMVLMRGCVKQQYLEGKRLPQSYAYGKFSPNMVTLRSRGFIASSFVAGLKPDEFLDHFRTARKSLIDQQQTSSPGTLAMHIEHTLNAIVVSETGAVIWSDGRVIAAEYGANGVATTESWLTYTSKPYRSPFNFPSIATELLHRYVGAAHAGSLQPGDLLPDDPVVTAIHDREARLHADRLHARRYGNHRGHVRNSRRNDGAVPLYVHVHEDATAAVLAAIRTNQCGLPRPGEGGRRGLPARIYDRYAAPMGPPLLRRLRQRGAGAYLGLLWHWEHLALATLPYRGLEDLLFFDGVFVELARYGDGATDLDDATDPADLFVRREPMEDALTSLAEQLSEGPPVAAKAEAVNAAWGAWVARQRELLEAVEVDLTEPDPEALVFGLRSYLSRERALRFTDILAPFYATAEVDAIDAHRAIIQAWERRLAQADSAFLLARYRRARGLDAIGETPLERQRRVRVLIAAAGVNAERIQELLEPLATVGGYTKLTLRHPSFPPELDGVLDQALREQDRFSGHVSAVQDGQVASAVVLVRDVLATLLAGYDGPLVVAAAIFLAPVVAEIFHERVNAWGRAQWNAPQTVLKDIWDSEGRPRRQGDAYVFEQFLFITLWIYVHCRYSGFVDGEALSAADAAYRRAL